MTKSAPIIAEWDGESLVPVRQFEKYCDVNFIVGERYRVTLQEERSANSHNHYFAVLTELWHSLPEAYDGRFPTMDHLRKYALIRTGYRDDRSIVCASKAEAQRVAAFINPMDGFALVATQEAAVHVYTAQSQSLKAMGRKEFQESKQAVLDYIGLEMIGLKPTEIQRAA